MSRILFLVVATILPSFALAQPSPINEGRGANLTTLLLHPSVSKELRLEKEQLVEVKRLAEAVRNHARFRPGVGDSVAQQRKKFLDARREREKLIRESDEKIAALLTPKQSKRAKQLLLQANIFSDYFDVAFRSLGVPVPQHADREELEALLHTVPIVVAHESSKLHFRLVKNSVDDVTPMHPGKRMMGKAFRLVSFKRKPAEEYERHQLTPLEPLPEN